MMSNPTPLLEKEVRRRILEETDKKARRLSEKSRNIPDEEIAKLVREDRETR